MRREGAVRCSKGSPRLQEAELSACRTAATSRRPLSSPWIRRPLVVDGSGIVRVAEPPELFQLKCLSHASGAVTHLNRNNPSVLQI
jgi:hypothetical protein